ncbi:UNVERIFIED_CONTAM: hypothetical protein PYX00_011906 [Menopon gallinae]|uniref:Transketolase-like pyrimidine-binding domain-containing protein n=1 Tax=Menopon gallinae TaxID=328185 RepID=A0AAW2H8Q0_9NEOP
MARDKSVVLLGEEVAQYNGPYKVSKGLLDKYGCERVIDTPITELGFTGAGVGMAMNGLRPVVEWMTMQFGLLAIDQIINNASKMNYMSGGQFKMPMVVRGPNGYAEYLASQHSQSFAAYFVHAPGIIVMAPSTPSDAKGMLKTAIRNDNLVIFLESELTYSVKGQVPEGEHLVPVGKADIKRVGQHISLISFSKTMLLCLEAAEILAKEGVEVEVIDLRTLSPLDQQTLFSSVRKTNHALVVDEAWPQASVGSWLDAPVELLASENIPMPYSHPLELASQPSTQKIVKAIKDILNLN